MVPFGDIILPFVGVLAIGLLLIAARLFFLSGLTPAPDQTAARPVPSVPDDALEDYLVQEVPGQADKPIVIEEQPAGQTLAVEITTMPVAGETDVESLFNPDYEADGALAQPDVPAEKSQPSQPAASPKAEPAKPATPKKEPTKPTVKAPSWRVQVGAYGSKRAAEDIVRKLGKSGYGATVFSGPKYHKVWVQAGSTKAAAERTAARLKTLGYPGSYVVPPPAK